jgi:predicted TIM-barrel fold metal-dependent hydrolase
MELSDYRPISNLVTKVTQIEKPRFAAIDAHNHLEIFKEGWPDRPLSELLDFMDSVGLRALIDLDGAWGEDLLERHLDLFKTKAPERFAMFGGVNWASWPEHGDRFGDYAASRLRAQVRRGAQGLKVWKDFGLHVQDQHGQRARINDARLDPLWAAAAELDVPITVHIADPVAFFHPLDANNERWEELHAHPDWHFQSPPFPPFLSLMNDFLEVIARHPQTTFIGAHVGCYAEDLGWIGRAFDRCPNFYIDISGRIAELGRQPYTARRFFIRYSDRILFGTDTGLKPDYYRINYRFLETDDEYFNYSTGPFPPTGRWQIYGLYLPDDVLEKVYYQNAARILRIP